MQGHSLSVILVTQRFPASYDKFYVKKIRHFMPKQIIDKSTAFSSRKFLCMHLCFKKVIDKIFESP